MSLLRSRRPRNALRPRSFDQGKSVTLPAPTGGLNLRDDISNLKPTEATILENWLPTTGKLALRPGKTHHASGMDDTEVKTLATFVGYSTTKLLAGGNGQIYDVTDGTYAATGNDTYTKVLLHFNGADAATTFPDVNVGGSSHTWTAAGNAQVDTAQSKFGGASGLFDGTGDIVSTPDHADFNLGTSDWTVDFWFNCTALTGVVSYVCGQGDATFTAAGTSFAVYRSNVGDTMGFSVSNGSTYVDVFGTTAFTNAVNTGWHHLAAVRTGNVLRLYIDGVQDSTDYAFSSTVPNSASVFVVGGANAAATTPWFGWVDEFRLSVGTARWTAAFTPPTLPYAPKSLASGFAQDRWQTALYSDRLQLVNGTDAPQVYDGTTVSAIVWAGSGLTNTNLINVALVRNRLWFCEANQAWVWYANVGQVTAASALTKFGLDQIAGGGYCMAVASWSRDGGDGPDDLTVFIMSTGEIIAYQGDPATSFALIGKYHGAPPIGRQCAFQVGGELVIITTQGLLPISTAIGGNVTAQDIAAIDPWGKVAPGFVVDADADRSNPGWHGIFHLGNVYVNVPQTTGQISKQYVLNTRTGAWTIYSSLNMAAMAVYNGGLYFGGMGGNVFVHSGDDDAGTDVTAIVSQAYVYPSTAKISNMYTAARPKIRAAGSVSGVIGVDVDFNPINLVGSVDFSGSGTSSAWNTSPWDTTAWGTDPQTTQNWYGIYGAGKAVSVRLSATSGTTDVEWYGTDLLFKQGSIK